MKEAIRRDTLHSRVEGFMILWVEHMGIHSAGGKSNFCVIVRHTSPKFCSVLTLLMKVNYIYIYQ